MQRGPTWGVSVTKFLLPDYAFQASSPGTRVCYVIRELLSFQPTIGLSL